VRRECLVAKFPRRSLSCPPGESADHKAARERERSLKSGQGKKWLVKTEHWLVFFIIRPSESMTFGGFFGTNFLISSERVQLHEIMVRGAALSFVGVKSEHNILACSLPSVESLIGLV
jgi:hypothetical protein